jgi:transcriptional regulator with XRE-family HTH domain
MSEFLVGKNEISELLLNQHLTLKQAAAKIGVTEKTLRKYAKVYAVDYRLWWKYQQIVCPECDIVIDPECQLPEEERKKLLKKGHVVCEDCKIKIRREKDRDRKRNARSDDREGYNTYQRDLMRKRRAAKKQEESNNG